VNDAGSQHFPHHDVVQRSEDLGTLGHPIAHGRAVDLDVMAFQNPLQAVQRLVIGVFSAALKNLRSSRSAALAEA
jgi:hypothetical protein